MRKETREPDSEPCANTATRRNVSTIGVLLGIGSIDHGVLEMMQGNRPTPGNLIKALGPGHSWTVWSQGSEPAFTLVHNFVLTGVFATMLGLLLIYWSARRIGGRRGPAVFLLLSLASFFTGGGLAQLFVLVPNWAAATRIHAPLVFWRRLLPRGVRPVLGVLWPWALAAAGALFVGALEIALLGYCPGVPRVREVLARFLIRLAAVLLGLFAFTYICGFARDAEVRARGNAK